MTEEHRPFLRPATHVPEHRQNDVGCLVFTRIYRTNSLQWDELQIGDQRYKTNGVGETDDGYLYTYLTSEAQTDLQALRDQGQTPVLALWLAPTTGTFTNTLTEHQTVTRLVFGATDYELE